MKSKRFTVAIIDYSMGNIYSIAQACRKVDLEPIITFQKNIIISCDAVILPGVGAFETAIKKINELNLIEILLNYAATGKPIIGICLGAQLLLQNSEEFGSHKGLGLIEGDVIHFSNYTNNKNLVVPHIGWNKVIINKNTMIQPISKYIRNEDYYFIHSYVLKPAHNEDILAKSIYDNYVFVSAIGHNNIIGLQFHPENSGINGLEIFNGIKEIIKENV